MNVLCVECRAVSWSYSPTEKLPDNKSPSHTVAQKVKNSRSLLHERTSAGGLQTAAQWMQVCLWSVFTFHCCGKKKKTFSLTCSVFFSFLTMCRSQSRRGSSCNMCVCVWGQRLHRNPNSTWMRWKNTYRRTCNRKDKGRIRIWVLYVTADIRGTTLVTYSNLRFVQQSVPQQKTMNTMCFFRWWL